VNDKLCVFDACVSSAGWQARHSHNPQQWRQQQQQQQQRQRPSHVARVTGKREEYDIEGITDPEDIWGEDADPEFIEVSSGSLVCPVDLRVL
jgi:transcription initiation factor TFIID subunit TAF12